MPEDNELQIATVSGVIYPLNRVTQFQVVPPKEIEKIGTISSGTDQMTLNNTDDVIAGLFIFADGVSTGTTVESILGNVLTLSNNATSTITSGRIIFYTNAEDGLLPLQKGSTIRFL